LTLVYGLFVRNIVIIWSPGFLFWDSGSYFFGVRFIEVVDCHVERFGCVAGT